MVEDGASMRGKGFGLGTSHAYYDSPRSLASKRVGAIAMTPGGVGSVKIGRRTHITVFKEITCFQECVR